MLYSRIRIVPSGFSSGNSPERWSGICSVHPLTSKVRNAMTSAVFHLRKSSNKSVTPAKTRTTTGAANIAISKVS